MRLTKTFEIKGYDKSFMVNELKVKEILGLMSDDNLQELTLATMEKQFSKVLLPLCSNVTMEELKEMAPSEIMTIWENFKEVNNSFFALARQMGLQSVIDNLKVAVIEDFGKLVVDSSKQVMLES